MSNQDQQSSDHNSQEQEIRRNLFVSPNEEVHSKIDIEHGQEVEPPLNSSEASASLRHPDVKAEKNASRAGENPGNEGNEQIINPKSNAHNQYR